MSLKDTRRRISSIKNTQKITKAMNLVSSAKYARQNHAVVDSKAYCEGVQEILRVLAGSGHSAVRRYCDQDGKRKEEKTLLVVVASDRGLCGALNANVNKAATEFVDRKLSSGVSTSVCLLGKKSKGVLGKAKKDLVVYDTADKVLDKVDFSLARRFGSRFVDDFLAEQFDSVYCCYPRFRNVLVQQVTIEKILPISSGSTEESTGVAKVAAQDWLFEPDLADQAAQIISLGVSSALFWFFMNAAISEHAARMTAMDNATQNADEVIRKLTLQYNQARQAVITKELIEITSGAEAL